MIFAAMDQYRKLWDTGLGGGPARSSSTRMNNFYGMGGQTVGETMGCEFIARVGAGVNPEQMHAERVNGYDPLAVIDAFRRKRTDHRRGAGAGAAGHRDLPLQRPLALRRFQLPDPEGRSSSGEALDPVTSYRQRLIDAAVAKAEALDEARQEAAEMVFEMFRLAVDLEAKPPCAY